MKFKFKNIFIPLLFLSASATAQFNTLTRKIPAKETPVLQNGTVSNAVIKEEKKKIFKKNLFGVTTKKDLKNQIDSLKIIMINFGKESGTKKRNLKKIEDSLTLLIKDKFKVNSNIPSVSLQKLNWFNEELKTTKIFMPLKSSLKITSPFSIRVHPIFGKIKMHNGIDLKANYEDVRSVLDGVVTETGWDFKGGGNYIKIAHFNRFETAYLHLSQIYYKVGEFVKAGFIIGKSGNSGNSTGPHLHFAVKEYGKFINPTYFLNDLIKVNHLITNHLITNQIANHYEH